MFSTLPNSGSTACRVESIEVIMGLLGINSEVYWNPINEIYQIFTNLITGKPLI